MPNSRPAHSFLGHIRFAACAFLLALVALVATPALATAQPAYVGAQVHSLWYERSIGEMQRELDMIQDLGGNTVRVDIGWSSLESDGKGQLTGWYLSKLDRFMQEAAARKLKVIGTLLSTPCWASSAPESLKQGCEGAWWNRNVQNYPPQNPADFGDAARLITSRYGSQLAAFEVWNEPNLERFLVSSDPVGSYAALVKAAYPAAKAGDPSVPVLAGSLAAADRPFLDALFARGIKGYYDGISAHPYNEWRDPYDRWMPQWIKYTFLPGIEWLREAQLAIGDTTPLWITEFGWDTCLGAKWCVDEEAQADYTVKSLQILNTLDYVTGATLYELRDGGTDPSDFEGNWGLVRHDFSPKPVYDAVRAQLHGEAEPRPITVQVGVAANEAETVVLRGRGAERQRLEVQVSNCSVRVRRTMMTSREGDYRRKLGSFKRLRGCKVKVTPQRSDSSVVRTVRKKRYGIFAARAVSNE
jgi:hypothetical protein